MSESKGTLGLSCFLAMTALSVFGAGCGGAIGDTAIPQKVETPPAQAAPITGEPQPQGPGVEVPSRRYRELMSVTAEYGPSIIRPGTFSAQTAKKPWSSPYYPLNKDYLFRSTATRQAPLQKWDAFVKAQFGRDSHAVDVESVNRDLYDPKAEDWAGRCHAWAVASVLEPEPTGPIKVGNIEFTVGDQKALIVKSYENFEGLKTYGQPFKEGPGVDWDDMYPEQFHRLLQVELFQKKKPIIVEIDPYREIWNHPVWRANTLIEADPSDPHVMHVKTYLEIATTKESEYEQRASIMTTKAYVYDLIGNPRPDGTLEVVYGVWTQEEGEGGLNSITDHPDFASAFPDDMKITHESKNPELRGEELDALLRLPGGPHFRDRIF